MEVAFLSAFRGKREKPRLDDGGAFCWIGFLILRAG